MTCTCTLAEGDDTDSSYIERLVAQDPACPIHRRADTIHATRGAPA